MNKVTTADHGELFDITEEPAPVFVDEDLTVEEVNAAKGAQNSGWSRWKKVATCLLPNRSIYCVYLS